MRSKISLFIVSLLLCFSAHSAVFPTGPSVTVGGVQITNTPALIVLNCEVDGASNGNCTFRQGTSSSGYTPSGSKAFVAQAITLINQSSSSASATFGYANNDVGFATNTSITSPVYYTGQGTFQMFYVQANSGNNNSFPVAFTIPNGKYGFLTNQGSSSVDLGVILYGYEQ